MYKYDDHHKIFIMVCIFVGLRFSLHKMLLTPEALIKVGVFIWATAFSSTIITLQPHTNISEKNANYREYKEAEDEALNIDFGGRGKRRISEDIIRELKMANDAEITPGSGVADPSGSISTRFATMKMIIYTAYQIIKRLMFMLIFLFYFSDYFGYFSVLFTLFSLKDQILLSL
ncbi:hypothetical protein ACJX0J_036879, partial [Zea mays]